jgi:hypothetical protein
MTSTRGGQGTHRQVDNQSLQPKDSQQPLSEMSIGYEVMRRINYFRITNYILAVQIVCIYMRLHAHLVEWSPPAGQQMTHFLSMTDRGCVWKIVLKNMHM